MAATAASSATCTRFLAKKQKVHLETLTADYITTVLPNMSEEEVVQVLLKIGPAGWKEATTTKNLSSPDVKKLVNLILSHVSLQPAFSVYLTLWELDEEPATFLYELGLGSYVRQAVVPRTAKNVYMFSMRMDGTEENIEPILPDLKHNKHYFCLSTDFVMKRDLKKTKQRINPNLYSPGEIFYKKMSSALVCVKLQRWCECFAFSLSALDDFRPEFACLHDVLCNIALSGAHMSVSFDWCCEVLNDAMECTSGALDHTWKRILVFQSLLIQNGFFDLEYDLFQDSRDTFLQVSDHFQTYVIQHIQAKMFQIEFNLVFQYVRQTYHSYCEDFCQKEPCLKHSSFATQKLLNQMDTLTQAVSVKGVKEYFRGYFYLYSTMIKLHSQGLEKKTVNIQLALAFFQLAKDGMKTSEVFYLDVGIIIAYLKKTPMTTQSIYSHFEKKSVVRNTVGAGHFFYRAMLITMYWDGYFQPFPITMLATHARELEMKLTNKLGFRIPLLTASIAIGNLHTTHTAENPHQDFPDISLSSVRKAWLKQATLYWSKEVGLLKNKIHHHHPQQETTTKNGLQEMKPKSALAILNKNKRAEHVYAFGYQLVEAWTFI